MAEIKERLLEAKKEKHIFEVGDVVKDQHNRINLVVGFDKRPSNDWLAIQSKPFIIKKDTQFISAFPFDGGAVCISSETTKFLRKATIEDLHIVYKEANGSARLALRKLFFGSEE